ncbi:MAG: biotin/lipoyl-binding protein [Gammaproteobacteria bacterium]
MSDSLYSPYWYRVSSLKPTIAPQVSVERHEYRGKPSFVLQDKSSGRHHRVNSTARYLVGLMDGQHTIEQIWDASMDRLGDAAPTQDQMIKLFGQLHSADLLRCDIPPDSAELFRRFQKHQKQQLKQRWMNPLAIRIPLFDPQQFLTRHLGKIQWLFSQSILIVYSIIILAALVLTGMHWPEITGQMFERALAPENLIILWLTYPVVKTLHEFGHAFATRVWGGEVHEMGITLLVLMPIPYVDASSANAFPDKNRRMIVGASGMLVEWFVAAMAVFIWVNAEPGLVRDVAWNVMLIGGLSTLLFNGNPLLRFDGYYILADAVEIPNLAKRSQQHLGYLIKRHLFGVEEVESVATSDGERRWFTGYGIASFSYRMFIMTAIILFIASKYFIVGILLAIWAGVSQIIFPLFKQVRFVLTNPQIRTHRVRAVSTSVAIILISALLLFVAPAPEHSKAEGVLWLAEQAHIRTGADGFVAELLTKPDQIVNKGDALIRLEDPELQAKLKILEAQVQELQVRYNSHWSDDQVQAKMVQAQIEATQADLSRTQERVDHLLVRSPVSGRFVVPASDDLPGRFLKQGEVVAYVVDQPLTRARIVVPQQYADRVRSSTQAIELRPIEDISRVITAQIKRERPAASNRLPSKALGTRGGGDIAVDPADMDGLKTAQSIFQFDLVLPEDANLSYSGSRVYVRFDHGTQPLGIQWYRSLRQLFLRQFSV